MSNLRLQIGQSSVEIGPGTTVIVGRDDHCNLVAHDPTVSRRHCEIYNEGGRCFIRDMGSSNGTWVNGSPVGQQAFELQAGHQVFVGHLPLLVQWEGAGEQGATVMGALPPELLALIQQRKAQAQQYSTPSVVAAPTDPTLITSAEKSQGVFNYRKQGSNNNGVLLIALPTDTFTNDSKIAGFMEFTALDAESVNEIAIELVEIHRKGAKKGHVWDRVLVKEGPWKSKKNDKVPSPFELRVPSATCISGKDVQWEVRGIVDIAWAYDVECDVEISMKNGDIDHIRDAMGMLDLRVGSIESKPLGQHFHMVFEPPVQWRSQWDIDRVVVDVEYMGTNIEVDVLVDKRGRLSKDKRSNSTLELGRFRAMPPAELGRELQAVIQRMLQLR